MRLIRFKVDNFRSVIESGWIDAERVTALIGVNESGKTNLLLPLWKLNPAREGEIRPTSDYPKANYAAVRENPGSFIFITAEFEVPADLLGELIAKTHMPPEQLKVVRVGRGFDGRYWVTFPNHEPARHMTGSEVAVRLDLALKELGAMSALDDREEALKAEAGQTIRSIIQSIRDDDSVDAAHLDLIASRLWRAIPLAAAPTSSIVPLLKRLVESLGETGQRLKAPGAGEIEGVAQAVLNHLPRFVYYSNYGNLDSEIYLPHVVHNLEREDLGAREAAKARTLRVLFRFVHLEPSQILELGRDFADTEGRGPTLSEIGDVATKKRERTILLNSAGSELTKKFANWWKQGDYTFEFQADGDHFRIWVSDRRRPEKVELEDRSSGLQWFLSFYLIFLVESSAELSNAILLLDEPGLSLHPLAQRDLSGFFENLAKTNQIIFTTHSPFLVDADMLDRVRKVFMSGDGSTKASSDLRRGNNEDPRKVGATYAIHSALNMSIAESLLYGSRPVIVEGPSDQYYMSAIKSLLIGGRRINPKREFVFPPSHGSKNARVVASILAGRDEVLPPVLLDGDDIGLETAKELQDGPYKNARDRILCTDQYANFSLSSTEDLFPPAFLANVVDRWERNADNPFADVLRQGRPLIPQIEDWAETEGIRLKEGWKVELARQVKRRALVVGLDEFDRKVVDSWTRLFNDF